MTYNDINGFIKIDHNPFVVHNWDSRNASLREHVYDVEDGGVQSCGGDRMERVVTLWTFTVRRNRWRVDIGTNAEPAKRQVQLLYLSSALKHA